MLARRPFLRVMLIACALTLGHIIGVLLLTEQQHLFGAFQSLAQWDSDWFLSVAKGGYHSTDPPFAQRRDVANVAFFPALPLLTRALHAVTGLDYKLAIVFVSQFFAWIFWCMVLLLLRAWKIPAKIQALGVLLILCLPTSFFLVVGYSESLLLAGFFGLMYWSVRKGRHAMLFAMAHGVLMTSSRLVGIPAAFYPLFVRTCTRPWKPWKSWLRPLAITAVSSIGTVAFFLFCKWKFGHWDLYMQTQKIGWNVTPQYLAAFSAKFYDVPWPGFTRGTINPEKLSHATVPIVSVLFISLLLAEVILSARSRRLRERLPLYACAFFLWYLPLAGMVGRDMSSMSRHGLPSVILLILAGMHIAADGGISRRRGLVLAITLILLALAMLWLQYLLAFRFVHEGWVA